MNKNIALVGFMGCGKTAVSRLLAKTLHLKLVSTDELIIQREKLSIAEIFAQKGEPYFRELERNIIAELAEETGLVIDCGGGVALQEENIKNLKQSGIIVYLKADVDTLHERTKHQKHRPLLNVEDPKSKIQELLLKREPFYAKADHLIDTSGKTANEVTDEIVRLIQ
jgi:shikimate kinase